MDFLEIRKKAKERAAAAKAGATAASQPAPEPPRSGEQGPEAPGSPSAPAGDSAVAEVEAIEGELAASLQGAPDPTDDRFTTWRPGTTDAPPLFAPVPPKPAAVPREDDFTVVTGLGARGVAAISTEPAEPAGTEGEPPDPLGEFFYRPDEAAPAVPEIGAPAHDAPEAPEVTEREEYLTFLLGSEEYAVAIERVREVIKAPPVTEVPRAPDYIRGVVIVRGDVVPVFDPRRRLGLPPAAPESRAPRIVIVESGEGPCGLLVDAVASVVRLAPGSIEPCPQGIAGASAEYIGGIGRAGERLFMVLDLGALLRRGPARAAGEGRGGDARA